MKNVTKIVIAVLMSVASIRAEYMVIQKGRLYGGCLYGNTCCGGASYCPPYTVLVRDRAYDGNYNYPYEGPAQIRYSMNYFDGETYHHGGGYRHSHNYRYPSSYSRYGRYGYRAHAGYGGYGTAGGVGYGAQPIGYGNYGRW
jgi:hypothetical protein